MKRMSKNLGMRRIQLKKYVKIVCMVIFMVGLICIGKGVFAEDVSTGISSAVTSSSTTANPKVVTNSSTVTSSSSEKQSDKSSADLNTRALNENIIGFGFSSVFINETSGNLDDTAVGDIIQRTVTMSNSSESVIGVGLRIAIESSASSGSRIPTVKEVGVESFNASLGSEELESFQGVRAFKLLPGETITLIQRYEIVSPSGIPIDGTLDVSSLSNNYEVSAYTFNNNNLEINATGFLNVSQVDNDQQNASYSVSSALPKLQVEKSVKNLSGKDYHIGDNLEYQIEVANTVNRSVLVSGVVKDTLNQYLDTPTNIKITYSDGSVESITSEDVYDKDTHELNVPLKKRLVGKDGATLTFETKLKDSAEGQNVTNTAYVDGIGLLGGYTSADYSFDSDLGASVLNSEILVDGTDSQEVPMVSDNFMLTPSEVVTSTTSTTTEPTTTTTSETSASTEPTTTTTSETSVSTEPTTTTSSNNQNIKVITRTDSSYEKRNGGKTLPATGETTQPILIILGFLLIAFVLKYKEITK
ncbi:isopeptide-forming domain-containing fimbrial protein [Enterococcus avium]|nr:isopeptide-forming domain-containing fimbrial protein [Enterococcus avium]